LERLSDPKIAAEFLHASHQESAEVFLSALGKVSQAKRELSGLAHLDLFPPAIG
jgi:hypothetical protein